MTDMLDARCYVLARRIIALLILIDDPDAETDEDFLRPIAANARDRYSELKGRLGFTEAGIEARIEAIARVCEDSGVYQ